MIDFEHEFVRGDIALPTILALHGMGGDEKAWLGPVAEVAPQWSVLSPRGQVLEEGKARFFRRFTEEILDLDDLERRAHYLAEFLIWAERHYGLDSHNTVVFGFSDGADIGAALLLLHPEMARGAALFRARATVRPKPLPDLERMQILLVGGERDDVVPASALENLYQIFLQCSAQVELVWHEGGHELGPADLELARGLLERIAPRLP